MAKNNTAAKIKISASIIGLLLIFAGIVAAFVTNTGDIGANAKAISGNTKVIDFHGKEDKIRDDRAHEDIEELEKDYVGICKDIEQINKSMTTQEKLMIEIVKALPK